MTEEQIERHVEAAMDALDRRFLKGAMRQEEYDAEVRRIDRWAKEAARTPPTTTCIEHAYGATTRLSFQIKVF